MSDYWTASPPNGTVTLASVTYPKHSYRIHVALVAEPEGGFSVLALNLPGAGSMGDTEAEAMANIREAVAGVLACYIADGAKIPFASDYDVPDGAKTLWIVCCPE